MEWLSENWVFILVFLAMMGMHLFGHGGHGGHGGHSQSRNGDRDQDAPRGRHRH